MFLQIRWQWDEISAKLAKLLGNIFGWIRHPYVAFGHTQMTLSLKLGQAFQANSLPMGIHLFKVSNRKRSMFVLVSLLLTLWTNFAGQKDKGYRNPVIWKFSRVSLVNSWCYFQFLRTPTTSLAQVTRM